MDWGPEPRTQDPEPSAARLGPRGFSAGVVDSLGVITYLMAGFELSHKVATLAALFNTL